MKALMTRSEHERFKACKAAMDERFQNLGQVFVPVAPEQKDDVKFTVLFVGQAVSKKYSFPDLAEYDTAWDKATDEVAQCCPAGKGVFWNAASRIVKGALVATGSSLQDNRYDDIVGFTNLAKIAKVDGNPNSAQIAFQAGLCVDQLKREIDLMKPTAIVMMVRNFAQNNIIEPVFGTHGWEHDTPQKDRVAFKIHSESLLSG